MSGGIGLPGSALERNNKRCRMLWFILQGSPLHSEFVSETREIKIGRLRPRGWDIRIQDWQITRNELGRKSTMEGFQHLASIRYARSKWLLRRDAHESEFCYWAYCQFFISGPDFDSFMEDVGFPKPCQKRGHIEQV